MGLKINGKEVVIIEAESELGAGTRGASLGPKAIRISDVARNKLFAGVRTITLSSYDLLFRDASRDTPFAKNIGSIYDFNRVLSKTVQQELEKGNFVIILSGDHSNAIGGVSGFRNYIGVEDCRIAWIDAHGDLHSPFTTPSGNMHGMPLAALTGHDNLDDAINELNDETIRQWTDLKDFTGATGRHLKGSEILFAGIRDLEEEEWDLVHELGIQFFDSKSFENNPVMDICSKMNGFVDKHPVYVSFDVDVLDPEISHGTGTPAPDGLKVMQVQEMLRCLLQTSHVHVLEITEVNPLLDNEGNTIRVVLDLLQNILKS